MRDKIYHWLITHVHYKIMYKHVWIDSQHQIWLPRWGASKRQLKEAKEWGDEMSKNIKWE